MNSECPTCPNLMPIEQKDARLQQDAINRALSFYENEGYTGLVHIEKLVNGSYTHRRATDPDKGREIAQSILIN